MPFNRNLLTQFRKAVGSQNKLANALYKEGRKMGTKYYVPCTSQTVHNWEHGHTSPNIKTLDVLALIARQYNMPMDFYVPPTGGDYQEAKREGPSS
jgi:hypothetical protein